MKTYKTRDGREARVFMIADAGTQPVFGAVASPSGKWHPSEWSRDGRYLLGGEGHELDLIDFPGETWKLPDPPPGQEWHRDDWTEEMLPDGYRPLLLGEMPEEGDEVIHGDGIASKQSPSQLQYAAASEAARQRTRRPLPDPYAELKAAHAAGKVIQKRHKHDGDEWSDWRYPDWTLPPEQYRVKPDPQPLGPEDVPPGSVIRRDALSGNLVSTPHAWFTVLGVTQDGVHTTVHHTGETEVTFILFKDLMAHQIKRPGEDWKPCYK